MIRLLTGLIAGGFWLVVLYLHSPTILFSVVFIITILALGEFYTISLSHDEQFLKFLAIFASTPPILLAYNGNIVSAMAGVFLSFVLLASTIIIKYRHLKEPFLLYAKMTFGMIYIGFCASHIFLISSISDGWFWLFFLSIIICASDSGAYYVGSAFGRTKLCPSVSPGKTVEGLLGGLFCATLIAILASSVLRPDLNLGMIVILAILLASLGVIGDLTESIFKRSHRIKDSGAILPGHGGILDRIDSLLLTAPALFYTLCFFQ